MNKNKLIDAYSDLMAHLYEAMDDTLHSFADAMDIAKAKIKDLSQEELEKVSGFLTRDVEHAAQHLDAKAENESLKEWFKFDIELLENFTFDAFLSLADKTRVELAKLGQLAQVHKYQSGDITSPGTFICDACGKEIAFKEPSEIPVCPACGATTFVRI
jgi:rubrerythrin